MRSFIITFILLTFTIAAFGQVDTLRLVEENSIEVSETIDSIYVEDITDSTRAIFITTANHIYAYDSQNLSLIWTSPEFTNPKDLQFGDINNDGYTDIAVNDNSNIYLFDVINNEVIWTSPELGSTYKCYTIGDRNNDSQLDLAYTIQIPTDSSLDYDSAFVNVFNGPDFSQQCSTYIPLYNYEHHDEYGGYSSYKENAMDMCIGKLTGIGGTENKIVLFTKIDISGYGHSYLYYRGTGAINIINSDDLSNVHINFIDKEFYKVFLDDGNNSYLYILCNSSNSGLDYSINQTNFRRISADSVLFSYQLQYSYSSPYGSEGSLWFGSVIDNNISDLGGIEMCIGVGNHLSVYGFPSLNCYASTYIPEETFNVTKHIYRNETFDNNYVICNFSNLNEYRFYSGANCSYDYVLSNLIEIDEIKDLDFNGIDEILSIDGNTLHIYHLDFATDIDKPMTLPRSTFIQPNFPNPFNATTTIEYGLESEQRVTIEIYDILGRKVHTLVDETKPAGLYQASWNAGETPTGVYFYKINAGDYNNTKKMMLLK